MADLRLDDIAINYYNSTKKEYLKKVKSSDKPEEKPRFLRKEIFRETFKNTYTQVMNQLVEKYSISENEVDDILLPKLEKESSNAISFDSENGIKESIKDYIRDSTSSKTIVEKIEQISPNVKTQAQENATANNENKIVDFNNLEEKKAYFDNLYNKIFEAETLKEQVKLFSENFYDISDRTEKEQKKIIEATRVGKKVQDLEESKIADGKDSEQAHKEAISEVAKNENISEAEVDACEQYKGIIDKIHIRKNTLKELKNKEGKNNTQSIKELELEIQTLEEAAEKLEAVIGNQDIEKDVNIANEEIDVSDKPINLEIDEEIQRQENEKFDISTMYGEIENETELETEMQEENETFDMSAMYEEFENETELETEMQEENEAFDKSNTYEEFESDTETKENDQTISNALVETNQNKFIKFLKEKLINPIKKFIFNQKNKETQINENHEDNKKIVNSVIAGNFSEKDLENVELKNENSVELLNNNNKINNTMQKNPWELSNYGEDSLDKFNAEAEKIIEGIKENESNTKGQNMEFVSQEK